MLKPLLAPYAIGIILILLLSTFWRLSLIIILGAEVAMFLLILLAEL